VPASVLLLQACASCLCKPVNAARKATARFLAKQGAAGQLFSAQPAGLHHATLNRAFPLS